MSLFRRSRTVEERAITALPWSHGGELRLSDSIEGSLSLVPVYAATRLISDSVSSLPLDQYRKTSDGRIPMQLAPVFDGPRTSTQVDWLGRCMTSLLIRGNAIGRRAGDGVTPSDVVWLNPDKVTERDYRLYYNGELLDDEDIVHIPALVVPGQRLGLSPIGACAATMTSGLETQKFMRDWYKNKAVPGLIFKNNERTLEKDDAAKVKARLRSTLRSGEPFVTGRDWSLDVIKLSAEDAGFVASSRLTATQVANIFGVPPEMIGGETGSSMTYATTEQQTIQFVTHTLRPWLVRLETAFSTLLPRPQFVKFNVDALIRVDTKSRYEVHQIARNIGLNNIDELRALEDQSPLPDGQGQDYSPLKSSPSPAAPSPAPTEETQ